MPMPRDRRLALGLPALLAALLFVRVLGAGFVYDDRPLLTENPRLQTLAAVGEAFTMPYWELVDDDRVEAGFYRPMGAAVLASSWVVSGGSAWFLHLVSLLLHAGCAAAVAGLALAMGWRPLTAGAAGVLFALHGAHVEAVAWISAIPELLATLFSVLALRAQVLRRPALTAGWLLLAMLSKEASFGVWLLCLGLALLRPAADRVRTLALLALPAAIVYLLRAQAFGDAAGWSWAAGFDRVTTHHGLTLPEQWTLSGSLLGRYLLYLVWPWPHRPFDPLRLDLAWNDAARLVPAVLSLLLGLAAGLLWLRRGRRSTLVAVALGLCFAALVPVMNTRSLGQFPFEERFLYLPSAGFCLLLAGLLLGPERGAVRPLWTRRLAPALLLLLGLGNAASAVAVTGHWQDEEALFGWAREVSPDSMTPHVEYGRLMLERAQQSVDPDDRKYFSDQAFRAYKRSLEVDPDKVLVSALERERGNLGQADALFLDGDVRAAEMVYQQIVDHYFGSAIGYLGLGNCHAVIALQATARAEQASDPTIRAQEQATADERFQAALLDFERALSLDDDLSAARAGKGLVLFQLGRFPEALPALEAAVAWQPWNFDYVLPLAQCYGMLGRLNLARRTLEEFLEAAPGTPQRRLVEQFLADLRSRQE